MKEEPQYNRNSLPSILQSVSPRYWLVLIALIVFGLVVGGYWHYRSEREFFKANHYKEIAAVAEMKSDQVRRWRRERFSDASIVMSGPVLRKSIAEIHRNPGAPGPRAAIRKRLVDMWEGGMYENIYLLANDGRILLSLKEDAELQNLPMNRAVEEAVAVGKPVLRDFYARLNGDIFIDVVAPVMDPGGKPLAVIVLQGNAKEFLYPLIQFRPFPSKTSETLLVRIEGKDVLFLNDLRHRPATALSLRMPLTQTDHPAVQAALGRRGRFEGRDYRGVEVLADLRSIPGTPWFMVAKIDTSEALAEARYRAGVLIVVGSLFILLVGAMIALLYRTLREAERKRAEEVLRTQLAFQEGIVEGAAEGICVCHNVPDYPNVRFTVWNSRMKEITGYSMEEINRLGWYQSIYPDPDLQARAVERMDRMRHGDNLKGEDWEITRSDGEKRLLSISTSILQGGKGIVHVLALMQDITDRKRAEESLRKSETDLIKAQKFANVGSWTWHIQSNRLEWSDQMFRIFCIDKEDFTGDLIDVIARAIHPEDRIAVDRANLSVIRDKKPMPLEYRIIWPDGTIRTVWAEAGELILDDAGDPTILTGIVQDITDRKHAEEELHRSENRFATVFRASPICISLTRLSDGYFLDINDAFLRLFGYEREQVIGRNPLMLDMWENPDDRARMIGILRERGRVDGFESTFRTKSGDIRNVIVISELIDVAGEQYILGLTLDITDRKRAEEDKVKLEAQLQQAMKMEAVGRLAGGVAHDFNNLLTAIIGNVSLALMKLSPSDPSAGMLGEAKKASERAARLTQQLLAFSRKQIIEPKVLDLNDLIAGLQTMLARLIGENIELRTVSCGFLGPVKVDPGQFEQVLVNLAVNARDAMPDGGKLVIETANVDLDAEYCARHPDASPGRFVMLAVSDTGHGMGEEVRKHIFEPFFTTKPKGSGTGLGLSTIYGAVRQSGGSIEVYSEEGRGTTFKIYLPRVEGEVPKPGRDTGLADLPEGSETVLVVEDEEIVRELCVKLLERLGYTVLQASNGDEAIALAREHVKRIDLLMTDVVMPGMNGRELADRLVVLHPETKVLFTSGYTDDAIVHHGVLDEGVAFIGKPYTLTDLARKIRGVLD